MDHVKEMDALKKELDELKLFPDEKLDLEFHSITWDDLASPGSFNLKVHHVRKPCARAYPTFVPTLPRVAISYELSGSIDDYDQNYNPSGEASRRLIIDAILKEALKITGHSTNRSVVLEPRVEHPSIKEFGKADYAISSESEDTDELDIGCFMLILEAKDGVIVNPFRSSHDKAVRQTLGYMASVLHRRENTHKLCGIPRKVTPVFGILSYGLYWEFYALDAAGVVYSGGPGIIIERPPNGFRDSIGLKKVVSWIIWILESIRLLSPLHSLEDLSVEAQEVNMKEIEKCFKN